MALNYEYIGKRIREERSRTGMSQATLAELSDSSPQYISHIENARKKASLDIIVRISNALGISVDQLLAGNQVNDRYDYSRELTRVIEGCSSYEKSIILDVATATKTSLGAHGWMTETGE